MELVKGGVYSVVGGGFTGFGNSSSGISVPVIGRRDGLPGDVVFAAHPPTVPYRTPGNLE